MAAPATEVPVASPGCSCIPPITLPAERVAMLQQLLRSEIEPMVSLTHLLRLCRDEHATLWEHQGDPRRRERVATLLTRVARTLPEPRVASTIGAEARLALSAALTTNSTIPPVVVAHSLAELLDARYGHAFADWFRHRSPYQPAVGDPIPLDTPDLRQVTELAPTAPPWPLANRLDETRRVRLAGAWTTQFRVVFDYSLFDVLTGVITEDTVIATCHPNHDLAELGLSPDRHGPTFPVEPANIADQAERIDRLLRDATDAGANIVVLPELSVTESLAHGLEAWVRRPGPLRLLVAGSFHHADAIDRTRRANRALAWVRGHPAPLTHDKYSPADRPVAEDITPLGWPEVRIHVTADGWHLVITVCRDLLNPHAVHALCEAGANLILAPAMSETLLAFGGPVAQLVGSWVQTLAQHTTPASPQGNDPVILRPAAVLALLTDGPDGPSVILTVRGSDLTHYSGQLVFPGGAADTLDRNAIDTALREAREEIGLDPTSVRVIGTLPALGLPDSGFLVTPVLAWSHQPRYLHPANPAEVTTVRTVPLSNRRGGQPRRPDLESDIDAPTDGDCDGDGVRVGAMTAAILGQLAAYVAAVAPLAADNT